MKVHEAAIELNVGEDFVRRLIRGGRIAATKDPDTGRVTVDADSVAAYRTRVSHKASSRSNATAERKRRMQAAEGTFA